MRVSAELSLDDIAADGTTSLTAFRVVQEALSNVLQHSPGSPVELRVATAFSFLRGASTPEELVERALALGYDRLAITDRDACCWSEAVDRSADLGTLAGLALCLRLLALVELLGRSPALGALFELTSDGARLHPALLRAAATQPLDSGARFDERAFTGLSSRRLPARKGR
jgi:hypothetical protein